MVAAGKLRVCQFRDCFVKLVSQARRWGWLGLACETRPFYVGTHVQRCLLCDNVWEL